jgi:PAS domain S-box-containing protein
MKIRTKIIVGFTVLLGLVLIEGIVEYRQVILARRDLIQLKTSALPETTLAAELIRTGAALENLLTKTPDVPPDAEGLALMDAFERSLQQAFGATSTGAALAQEQGAVDREGQERSELDLLKNVEAGFTAMKLSWLERGVDGATAERNAALHEEAQSHWRQGVKPLLLVYQQNAFDELRDRNSANLRRAQNAFGWLLGTAVVAFIATVGASYWLVKTVVTPLGAAADVTKEITEGHLTRRLNAVGNDEFSQLARSVNHMLDSLEETARARDEFGLLAASRLEELDDFFKLSQDVLGIANAHGHFLRINPAFAALLGYPTDELLNRPYLEFIHPDDRAATEAEGAKLMRGEPTRDFENRYLSHEGSYKWISWHVTPRLQPGLFYCVGRDITEKKSTELRLHESQVALCELNARLEHRVAAQTTGLHESEERFRMLVESVSDYAIFLLDVNGRIASWNAGAERINGYKAEEIIGQHIATFYSEADAIKGKPLYGLEVAKSHGRFEDAGWRVCKDGHTFWASVVINAIRGKDGELRGFAKITRDITEQQKTGEELKRQQELLRALMENLAEGVVACDAAGKLMFFNKVAREWHGTDIRTVPPEKWAEDFDIYGPDGVTHLEMEDIPLVRAATGEHVRNAEMVIVRKNYPPRYVIASGDPLMDAAGEMIGAVVVMRDITERRNAERHSLRTQRLESLGTLSGGIAHDLNNALTPILMGMELLKMQFPGSTNIISGMEKSAQRGAGMVRQLLTFAKGVDGERVLLQPRHFITEMESIIERTFPKNIETRVVAPGDVRRVMGDATQIHQVLLNLCVNARDAMPDGGTLSIEADNHVIDAVAAGKIQGLKAGSYVRIRVGDTGSGIPAGVIDHIFDPFFSTKPADKGTGLGLSTVMGIIRSHGGCVQVASTPHVGTLFTVLLPAAGEGVEASRAPFATKVDFVGGKRLVLIVDDEPAVREIARAVLESLDLQVLTADDGEVGMRQIKAYGKGLSLIISDRNMPKMDGMQFVEKARELLPDVPVIVSSGRIEKADATLLADMGVRTLLPKPFTQCDLIAAMKATLGPGSPPVV